MTFARDRIDALTGIRFFAALAVVLYHFWEIDLPGAPTNLIVENGFVGVSFFFVLSGYILSHVYLRDDEPVVDHRKFWLARFARIYPVYVLSFALQIPGIVWLLFHSAHALKRLSIAAATLAVNLALMQSWWTVLKWRWNFPAWSLSCEAFFYLIFPWLAISLVRRASPWQLFKIIAVCYALTLVAPAFLLSRGIGFFQHQPRSLLFELVVFGPIFRIPEFVIGVALGRLDRFARLNHMGKGVRVFCVVGGLVGGCCFLLCSRHIPYVLRYTGVADLIFAMTIFGLATSEGIMCRVCSLPMLVLLGEASYGMYILQAPIAELFAVVQDKLGLSPALGHTQRNAVVFVAYLATLTVLSVWSFKYFEAPVRKWMLRTSCSFSLRDFLLHYTSAALPTRGAPLLPPPLPSLKDDSTMTP